MLDDYGEKGYRLSKLKKEQHIIHIGKHSCKYAEAISTDLLCNKNATFRKKGTAIV